MVERQSCKLKVLGSIPSGGLFSNFEAAEVAIEMDIQVMRSIVGSIPCLPRHPLREHFGIHLQFPNHDMLRTNTRASSEIACILCSLGVV